MIFFAIFINFPALLDSFLLITQQPLEFLSISSMHVEERLKNFRNRIEFV